MHNYFTSSLLIAIMCVFTSSKATAAIFGDDVNYHIHLNDIADETTHENVQESLSKTLLKLEFKDEEGVKHYRLHKNAKDNEQRLLTLLQSQGYYSAEVDYQIDAEKKTPEITFTVIAGTPLTIYAINILLAKDSESHQIKLPNTSELRLKTGQQLIAEKIINTQNTIHKWVEKHNCIKAALVEHKVLSDLTTHKAEVFYTIRTGPKVTFGDVQFKGLETITKNHLIGMVEWQEKQCFNQSLVVKTQNNMLQSGLLTSVEHELLETHDTQINVIFTLNERTHRTIKTGLRFDTDEGPGITAEWQHRNFFR